MSLLPWHNNTFLLPRPPQPHRPYRVPSGFAIPGDPDTEHDAYLYYDAKRWFALMDDFEKLFASSGDCMFVLLSLPFFIYLFHSLLKVFSLLY